MAKKAAKKEVKETTKEVATKETQVARVSTNNLLKSDKAEDKISGVARVLAECYSARNKEEKRQSVVNKISKGTISLRTGKVSEDDLEKAKGLVNKSWKNIKECMTNEKTKLSKEAMELFNLVASFSKKDNELPDEILF